MAIDDFGKKLSAMKQTTVQKTHNLAEIMKLKNEISTIEKELNDIYASIGKKYFSLYRDNYDSQFIDTIEALNRNLAKAEELKQKLNALENMQFCPRCGAAIEENNKFCIKCGKLIDRG